MSEHSTERRERLLRTGKYVGAGMGLVILLVVLLFTVGVLGVPSGEMEENRWGEVDTEENDVEVITQVGIDNPNPFGFGGDADVAYDISLQDVDIAHGGATGITVGSGYNSQNLSTLLAVEQLPAWWSAHLNNNETSALAANATVDASLGPLSGSYDTTIEDEIETDMAGAFEESFSAFEGDYTFIETGIETPTGESIEPSVEISDVETEWGNVTDAETEILTTMQVHNDNPYPIPTPAFAGEVEMNGEELVTWTGGELTILDGESNELIGEQAYIEPGETEVRTFLVVMDNENVAAWFPTHVDSQQPDEDHGPELTGMAVTGQLALEINGEQFTMPDEGKAVAYQFDLATSIFIDQEDGVELQIDGQSSFEQSLTDVADELRINLEETEWWDGLLSNGSVV